MGLVFPSHSYDGVDPCTSVYHHHHRQSRCHKTMNPLRAKMFAARRYTVSSHQLPLLPLRPLRPQLRPQLPPWLQPRPQPPLQPQPRPQPRLQLPLRLRPPPLRLQLRLAKKGLRVVFATKKLPVMPTLWKEFSGPTWAHPRSRHVKNMSTK